MTAIRTATLLLLAAGLNGCCTRGPVEGVGVMDSYRMADRGDRISGDCLPQAYWVNLKAAGNIAGSRDVMLYVQVAPATQPTNDLRLVANAVEAATRLDAGTSHEPGMDRYLLRGRTLKFRGRPIPAAGETPAYVDTAVKGGRLEIVFDAIPARRLADLAIGKRVVVEGAIEPRALWMKPFDKEDFQTWQLVVALPSGETVDIGDRFFVEPADFQVCLATMRQKRTVKVRVIGVVQDAAPVHALAAKKGFVGTQRDIRGDRFVSVEQLGILGDEPANEVKP